MGKRGPKPKKIIDTTWTANLAYAIGLIASDGCLSPAGHLIDLTSNDREQLENYLRCLRVPYRITHKNGIENPGFRVQFKSVLFYEFLISIGITPAKSKTIGRLKIPKKYFFDFLRGSFDGDGTSYAYWDKRWKSSYMFYTEFASASRAHILWLQTEIFDRLGIRGHITGGAKVSTLQLKYAKKDSLKLLGRMYYSRKVICLKRKRLKIERILGTVGERL